MYNFVILLYLSKTVKLYYYYYYKCKDKLAAKIICKQHV